MEFWGKKKRKVSEMSGNLNMLSEHNSFTILWVQLSDYSLGGGGGHLNVT